MGMYLLLLIFLWHNNSSSNIISMDNPLKFFVTCCMHNHTYIPCTKGRQLRCSIYIMLCSLYFIKCSWRQATKTHKGPSKYVPVKKEWIKKYLLFEKLCRKLILKTFTNIFSTPNVNVHYCPYKLCGHEIAVINFPMFLLFCLHIQVIMLSQGNVFCIYRFCAAMCSILLKIHYFLIFGVLRK